MFPSEFKILFKNGSNFSSGLNFLLYYGSNFILSRLRNFDSHDIKFLMLIDNGVLHD